MGVLEFIITIVAMVLGAITIWIFLLRKDRRRSHIEAGENYDLNELSSMAQSMKERIDILESILDAEVPNWREQLERGSQ